MTPADRVAWIEGHGIILNFRFTGNEAEERAAEAERRLAVEQNFVDNGIMGYMTRSPWRHIPTSTLPPRR